MATPDELEKKLEKLPEKILPPYLHGVIMKRVWLLRFKRPAVIMTLLLVFNLAVSSWRVWVKFSEIEGLALLRIIFNGFAFEYVFFLDLWRAVVELFPVNAIVTLTVSFTLLGYLGYISHALKNLLTPKVE